jgi:hypothetical protein
MSDPQTPDPTPEPPAPPEPPADPPTGAETVWIGSASVERHPANGL